MVIRVPDQRRTPGGYAALDDRLLVLDFQAGNPQAFVEIHHRYGALARHVCQRFLPQQQDVDEAFQETMIRVFQGLYRFNGRYALQPWIARIAKNVSLDILRGRARRPQTDESAPAGDELPQPGDEADDIVERLVQRDTVLAVLADLPETHRRALVLRELEGRSHREVAHELEISTSQAKALIHRARGSFRRRWLEKVADRGGSMGIALLPLLWLARLGNGVRRVVDRVAVATHVAQVAAPEAVTSTVSASAAPATSGVGERLVAAGMTLLLAGGVTVGAVKVVNGSGDKAADRVEAETVAVGDALIPTVPGDRADEWVTDKIRESGHQIQAEPPVVTEPSPIPAPDPSPSPDVGPVVEPAPDPAPSPDPIPSPSPTPPPIPAWDMVFSSDVSSEETCDCPTARSIRTKVDGTPGEDVTWYQLAWGPVLDGEGDVAWSVAIEHRATVRADGGTMDVRFTIRTQEGSFLYTGIAALSQTARNDEGGYSYRFVGSFRARTAIPEEAVAPRNGQLTAQVDLWTDGTLYLGSFALVEA